MHHAQNRTQNEQKSQYKKTDKVKELVVVLFSILRSRGCRDRMREVCVRCRVPVPVRALMQMRGAHARATLQYTVVPPDLHAATSPRATV